MLLPTLLPAQWLGHLWLRRLASAHLCMLVSAWRKRCTLHTRSPTSLLTAVQTPATSSALLMAAWQSWILVGAHVLKEAPDHVVANAPTWVMVGLQGSLWAQTERL